MSGFVNLHVHDQHSLLDGAAKPEDYAARAAELGQTHLAQTNHGSLTGSYEHWKACRNHGVTPILGIELYLAPEGRKHLHPVRWGTPEQKRDDVGDQGATTHMTVIAKNAAGLRNLYKIYELSWTEGFYRKPRADLELLERYSDGLIATTGCAGGVVPTRLRLGQRSEAVKHALELKRIFGGDVYVELMWHLDTFDGPLNEQLVSVAEECGIELLATADSHYCRPEDARVHDAFLCIQTKAKLADEDRFRFQGDNYHLMSCQEMLALGPTDDNARKSWQKAIANTLVVASQVTAYDEVFEKRDLMPKSDSAKTLRQTCWDIDGPHQQNWDYHDRLQKELSVIEKMNYPHYFLVLAEIIEWAKSQGIAVGPGRGSAGGSLVAYLLGITEVDPIKHELLFERFLSLTRVSPPDVDVDFQDDRRQEVLSYVSEKYGSDSVARIVTFGTIKAKSAIGDANRVLGNDYANGQRLVEFVPKEVRGRTTPLKNLRKLREADPEVYQLASGLEGLIRDTSKHAAGVVISPVPLSDVIPVKKDKKDDLLTCGFPQVTLEEHGLVKYDFLGLKELSIITRTLEHINREDPDR